MTKIQIKNIYDLGNPTEREKGTRFEAKHYEFGISMETKKIGFNITDLAPGKTTFPYHFHYINEELFLVLEGEGTLRSPLGNTKIKKGDVIFCPTGETGAHQISNTGQEVLRYIAFSSLFDPEVVEYPDSAKFGVSVGRTREKQSAVSFLFRYLGFKKDIKDYWDGENLNASK